jgi:hypothetical protein
VSDSSLKEESVDQSEGGASTNSPGSQGRGTIERNNSALPTASYSSYKLFAKSVKKLPFCDPSHPMVTLTHNRCGSGLGGEHQSPGTPPKTPVMGFGPLHQDELLDISSQEKQFDQEVCHWL